ncbi:MAG TPA: S8 family peptidase [Natronosporangium sp.]|nr:S8 family peptidase [Natronosporangium sp.]
MDPELVLVLELNRRLDPDRVRPAGLSFLEFAGEKALVTFADDPELKQFLRILEAYQQGARPPREEGGPERAAAYEELFDAIEAVRRWGVEDVISDALRQTLDQATPKQLLRLDVQCWCPDDPSDARRRRLEVSQAVTAVGGKVLDKSLRHSAGLSLLRVELPADEVVTLAQVDHVRSIDILPRPALTQPQVWYAGPDSIPPVLPPLATAATVAVIDSGVRSAHPLLAPAVVGAEVVGPGLADAGDESGHGTLVSSLALHGQLEGKLAAGVSLRPAGRLLSIRVLDNQDQFPDVRLWEEHLHEAITLAINAGARVINLSLGDVRHPYRPPRPTPLSALIDNLARDHNLVVVISAGNYSTAGYAVDEKFRFDYPLRLLSASDSGILDPAPAALSLTIGAVCADPVQGARPAQDRVDVVPVGGPDQPSPVTRVGPGVGGMIKPELVAPGGSLSVDEGFGRIVNDPSLAVVGAGATADRLLAWGVGTSYAAPLASHAALRVLGRYPTITANAVRALVMASAQVIEPILTGSSPSNVDREQARLTGYGRLSAERAEASDDHRAVLLAEEEIEVDGVHLYVVPLPETFFEPGGTRTLALALAYDPRVRPTRLDYLASRMMVRAYRGVSREVVAEAYAQMEQADDDISGGADAPSPASIRPYEIELQPADTRRGLGANQYARRVFRQRLRPENGREIVVVVRNTNRWDLPTARQRYALAVVLERDPSHSPLYAELRAQLEALAEVELEIT